MCALQVRLTSNRRCGTILVKVQICAQLREHVALKTPSQVAMQMWVTTYLAVCSRSVRGFGLITGDPVLCIRLHEFDTREHKSHLVPHLHWVCSARNSYTLAHTRRLQASAG
jgi:hypothetical protein